MKRAGTTKTATRPRREITADDEAEDDGDNVVL